MQLYLNQNLCKGGECPHGIDKGSCLKCASGFGKPMEKREGESSNDFMSRIISHLMKDKGYDQKQAVAAAYEMSGHPKGRVNKSLTLWIRK